MDNGGMQEVSRKRNLEKRRETSRYAARDRRGKEADIFVDLREVVPIVEENTVTHVDRIALLRVAATMCRMRNHIGKALQAPLQSNMNKNEIWSEDTISECLDGFIMMIDMDGLILYVTESVSIYLGITQTDLVGRYLREFANQKDYEAYMKLLQANKAKSANGNTREDANPVTRTIVLRMKSVISPRGRNLNLKSAIYKPVWVCYRTMSYAGNNPMNMMHCSTNPAGTGANISNAMSGVASKNGEYSTGTGMTRHTCDMKISFISENMNKIVRSNQRSLIGTSFYDLVHPGDVARVSEWIRDLLVKSHCRTSFYRILGTSKSVIWVQTDAITVNHTIRGKKEQYIICTHFFLGTQTDITSAQSVSLDSSCAMPLDKIIKKEIIDADSPEYGGLQPMFVECVDFTPLIPNEPSLLPSNLDEYTSVDAPSTEFGRSSPQQFQPQGGQIARKSSYDDVLQWLFRDHPDSPAPFSSRYDQTLRTNEDDRDTLIGENPPLRSNFSVQLHDPASRRQSPELAGRSGKNSSSALYRHQRSHNSDRSTSTSAMGDRFGGSYRSSPLSSNASNQGQNEGASPMEWSPLAAGIADCNLRSPVRSTVDGVSCITGPFRENSASSGVPFLSSISVSGMRSTNGTVPAISQPDGYNLVPGTNAYRTVGSRPLPRPNVYSNVSLTHCADARNARTALCTSTTETPPPCSGVRRPFGQFEPQQFVPLRVGQPSEPSSHNNPSNNINYTNKSANDGSMHKSPLEYSQFYVDCQDNLRSLAPFVAHEDEFQLTTSFPADLQGLFSDDPSDDWMNSFGPINTGSVNTPSVCGGNDLDNCNNFVNDRLF